MSKNSLSIVALRHTNARPLGNTGIDEARDLSETGVAQAMSRANSPLFSSVADGVQFVCVSPAMRAVETAQHTFGGLNKPFVAIPALYMPPAGTSMHEECEKAFDKLKYAPARKYYEYEGGLWLQRYAVAAASAVLALADARDEWRIGLVGHAICLNAIGAVLSPLHADVLLDLVLGEGHGFAISESGAFMVIND